MVDPYRVPGEVVRTSEPRSAERADQAIAAVLFAAGAAHSALVVAHGEAFGAEATIALFVALAAGASLLRPLVRLQPRLPKS